MFLISLVIHRPRRGSCCASPRAQGAREGGGSCCMMEFVCRQRASPCLAFRQQKTKLASPRAQVAPAHIQGLENNLRHLRVPQPPCYYQLKNMFVVVLSMLHTARMLPMLWLYVYLCYVCLFQRSPAEGALIIPMNSQHRFDPAVNTTDQVPNAYSQMSQLKSGELGPAPGSARQAMSPKYYVVQQDGITFGTFKHRATPFYGLYPCWLSVSYVESSLVIWTIMFMLCLVNSCKHRWIPLCSNINISSHSSINTN